MSKQNAPRLTSDGEMVSDNTSADEKYNPFMPYACSCCGYANGDMFQDYIKQNAEKLTYAEVMQLSSQFDRYRHYWDEQSEASISAVRGGRV